MDIQEKTVSPLKNIWLRLRKNVLAMIGLAFIALATFLAIFGYIVMPDSTPLANDGAVQLQKKTPVFRVTMLGLRKNMEIEKVNFFSRMLSGQESEYIIVPIVGQPEIVGDSVYFVQFPGTEKDRATGKQKQLSYSLVNCVKPISNATSDQLEGAEGGNFISEGDEIKYLNLQGEVVSINRDELIAEFWEDCIEERTYWLGTDKSGRDLLSRLLFGTRISLGIGAVAVIISLTLGVFFGGIAGFFGGKIDSAIMWLMTVIWSVPTIMLVIAISLVLQSRGIWVAFVAVGLTMWVDIARVVRGQILGIKQKLFVEAAHALGYSSGRIIFLHIMPNIFGPLIVICTSNFASAILIEAGLSFLGLGVSPPTPSWGMMINDGFRSIASKDSWHLIWFPSLCISITVLCFNLLGNGLRDATDPKSMK